MFEEIRYFLEPINTRSVCGRKREIFADSLKSNGTKIGTVNKFSHWVRNDDGNVITEIARAIEWRQQGCIVRSYFERERKSRKYIFSILLGYLQKKSSQRQRQWQLNEFKLWNSRNKMNENRTAKANTHTHK